MSAIARVGTVLAIALALATGGCLSVRQSYPEKRMHAFTVDMPAARDAAPDAPVLRVAAFNASPAVRGSRFVYLTSQGLTRDYYNEFAGPPAALVGHAFRQRLAAAGLFGAVLEEPSRLQADLVLEGTLVALHADAKAMTAVIEVQLLLLDDTGEEARLLMNKSYRQEATLDEFTPEAAMAGWDTALAAALAEAQNDIARAVENR